MSKQGNLAVVAVGGNALIKDNKHNSFADQLGVAHETAGHIAGMVAKGWNVVVTHGNGPQVGHVVRRVELALNELPMEPMDGSGANTQGSIGYMMEQALDNVFKDKGINKEVAAVVTQTIVDPKDQAFSNPTKPIGSFMDEETAKARAKEFGWTVVEDAGRGWRRVVPSPRPKEIVEFPAIKTLAEAGIMVVCTGGGGIPVIRKEDGHLYGVAAVIDKDFGTAVLASNLEADLFIISTAVPQVYINFNKPDQKALGNITLAEAEKYLAEGHFAKGSMAPKMQAVINFLKAGGKHAIITDPAHLAEAIDGKAGTHITK